MVRWWVIATVMLAAAPALAHDHWINHQRLVDPVSKEWCCNENDCASQKAGSVVQVAGGYFLAQTGETIAIERVIWKSADGDWWRCRNLATDKTRCLIGPPPGS